MEIISETATNGNDNILADAANDSINSLAGNDTVNGGGGNDTLNGGAGNDLVIGAKDNDRIIGGLGNDTLVWADGDGSDRISGNAGADMISVQGSLTQGDNFVLGQQGTQAIFDRINLRQFKLTVDTTEQFTVVGEGSNDRFDVNNLSNTSVNLVTFSGGAGNDTLDGNDTSTRLVGNGNAGNDYLIGGDANDILNGGFGNDFLKGDGDYSLDEPGGNDILNGGAGNDTLLSVLLGDSTLSGGLGNDNYVIVDGDIIIEPANGGIDTVRTYNGFTLPDNVENLILEDPKVPDSDGIGNELNNIITGTFGNNVLRGEAGNDDLNGNFESDTLTGGTGADSFTLNPLLEGIDLITDFVAADDSIRVLATGFGGELVAGATIRAEQFRIGAAAADASERFIYNNTNGALFFDPDGVGGTAQDQIATLVGAPTINNTDIIVI